MGNLSLWSIITNKSSLLLAEAKLDAMNQEGNVKVNFIVRFIAFYKFSVTVSGLWQSKSWYQARYQQQ